MNFDAALSEYNAMTETAEGGEEQQGQEVEQQAAPQPAGDLYEFDYNGNKIALPLNHELPIKHNGGIENVPLERLFNIYRQRSHLEKKFQDERQKLETERGELETYNQMREKYEAIQNWSEQNPDAWERLYNMFQQKEQLLFSGQTPDAQGVAPAGVPPEFVQEFQRYASTVEELKKELQTYKQRDQELQDKQDVASVEQEIAEFAKSYPGLDLTEKDLDGLTLKARIIQHGLEKGYPDFQSAALTFVDVDGTRLLDKVMATVSTKSRNEVAQQVKADRKAGVLNRSSTPSVGQGEVDVRRLSRDGRFDAALDELESKWNG